MILLLPADAHEDFSLLVVWREVTILDRPVCALAVARIAFEVAFVETICESTPKHRTSTYVTRSEPIVWQFLWRRVRFSRVALGDGVTSVENFVSRFAPQEAMRVCVWPGLVVREVDQVPALRACFEHCHFQTGLNELHRGSAAGGAGTDNDDIIDDLASAASCLPSRLSPHRLAFP